MGLFITEEEHEKAIVSLQKMKKIEKKNKGKMIKKVINPKTIVLSNNEERLSLYENLK